MNAALLKAQAIQVESAAYRREIAALPYRESLLRVAELLDDPPEAVQRMRVGVLLRAVRRFGSHKANEVLDRVGILNPGRQVGPAARRAQERPLAEEQRRRLAAELRRRAA